MPRDLPERMWDSAYGGGAFDRGSQLERRVAREVDEYEQEAIARGLVDETDSQVLSDVITYATEEELRFWKWGLSEANGSELAIEIVGANLDLMCQITRRRIARRFGGR